MKIMHITKKYPHALGGDAVVVSNLEKQQKAGGHEVKVVTSNCREIGDAAHVYKVGLPDTPSRLDAITLRRLVSLAVLFLRLFAILRRERPDVIHTHSVDMAFFASWPARIFGIPLIHTFHIVTFYDEQQSAFRRKTEMWLAKRARAKHITAPNEYDVKKLQAAGLSQAVLLPNGVDLQFWGKTAGKIPKDENFTFVAVGRLEQQKGYEYLIRAAALLAATRANFKVIITGEGSQKKALQDLAHSLHLDKVITLMGRQTPEKLRERLVRADAVVSPSLYETTPLTLLEAWAARVPVVATSVGILRDVPAHFKAAYVVPPRNEQALMRAMQRCMADDQRRLAVAAQGRKEVQKYTWAAVAQTAEAIYGSVVRRSFNEA